MNWMWILLVAIAAIFVLPRLFGGSAASPSKLVPGTVLANEGQSFTIPAPGAYVKYGARDKWVTKMVSGTGVANNDFFGVDPIFGVQKQAVVA
jgi:hypothetical protein